MNQGAARALGGLLALSVTGLFPLACVMNGGGSGGGGSGGGTATSDPTGADKVGVACVPPDEWSSYSVGVAVSEDVIVQGAAECGAGVCLLNHFQGRVSCPLGQDAPLDAQGLRGCVPDRGPNGEAIVGQGSCAEGDNCTLAGSKSPSCDPSQGQQADQLCAAIGAGGKCNAGGFCECKTDADCAFVTDGVVSCDVETRKCLTYACHAPGSCQAAGASDAENQGKACCVPGTDTPVSVSVCGQCAGQAGQATRDAENAVYCSCRCGVAEGAPDEPDYPFCACPDGFECSEIRKNVGLGDASLSGKYCVKAGTAFDATADQCGQVNGHFDERCDGTPAGD